MNKTKIRKLVKYLGELPEESYSQNKWFHARVGGGSKRGTLCGTTACIGGHAVIMERGKQFGYDDVAPGCRKEWKEIEDVHLMAGEEIEDEASFDFGSRARRILGLTKLQASRLFSAVPCDEENPFLYTLVREPTISDAIRALHNIMRHPQLNPWTFLFIRQG